MKIGQQEVTVHPKFKLYLRAESVEYKKDLQVLGMSSDLQYISLGFFRSFSRLSTSR